MPVQSKHQDIGFFAGLWASYLQQLTVRPVLTKSLTQFVFSAGQELAAQFLVGQKSYDVERAIKLGLYGFLISSPFSHYMIELMNSLFANVEGPTKIVLQLLFANLVTIPISVALYFVCTGLMDGASMDGIRERLKTVPVVLKRLYWRFYPPFLIILYRVAPPALWLPCLQIYGFILGTSLSVAAKRATPTSGKDNKGNTSK